MNKLLKNYNLSLWIVRIVYVLLAAVTQYALMETWVEAYGFSGESLTIVVTLLVSLLDIVLLNWFVGLLLRMHGIFYVPINEYKLLAVFCGCIAFGIKGLFQLLILVMPYAGLWLTYVGAGIAVTVAMMIFYFITSKQYTNDMTRPHYLRAMLFAYVMFFILGV